MQNHWLNAVRSKQLFKEIDEVALDVWGSDGTLGDFFAMLNDEQTDLLFAMKVKNASFDQNALTCEVELKSP
jgi:hypothetical protein